MHVVAADLQQSDQHHQGSDGVHQAAIVGQQGLTAAALPHVELLCVVVVAVVGRVVGHLALDAGPGGAGVAAAERDSVHQVLAVHVAPNAAKRMKQSIMLCHAMMVWKSELKSETRLEVRKALYYSCNVYASDLVQQCNVCCHLQFVSAVPGS